MREKERGEKLLVRGIEGVGKMCLIYHSTLGTRTGTYCILLSFNFRVFSRSGKLHFLDFRSEFGAKFCSTQYRYEKI